MKNDITMYVNTCNATMDFIPIFAHLFDKYWIDNTKVKVLGYSPINKKLPDRFEYISMAPEQVGGVQCWSSYLIDYFESIDDEIILWGIDDHLIVDYLDVDIYNFLVDKIKNDSTIGRISLIDNIVNRQHTIMEKHNSFDLILQNVGTNYRIDCQFSLWNKKYLLDNLKRDWTPWQFEINGSNNVRYDNFKILGTSKTYCINRIEGKRHFEPSVINLLGAKYRDIIEMINLGLVNKEDVVGRMEWIWTGKE